MIVTSTVIAHIITVFEEAALWIILKYQKELIDLIPAILEGRGGIKCHQIHFNKIACINNNNKTSDFPKLPSCRRSGLVKEV